VPPFSQRFVALPDYPLATIPQRKRALIEAGVDVIDLGAGDADLAPPPAALARMEAAVTEPSMSRYGFGMGHVPYREAVSAFMQKRFGVQCDPMTEVVPLLGSKEGISHLAFAYMEQGAVGIIPEPGYNAYQGGTLLGGGEAYRYALRPRTKFLLELDEIPDDILRRARILYLNYPNNPTAAVAPMEYLERVVKICRQRDILLVYDNAYSEMAFDGYVPPSIFEVEGARDVAVQDVQHDGLALRVGRGAARGRAYAREDQVVHGYGAVHGDSGRGRRRAGELGELPAAERGGVQGAS
jgi:LL-diaminopimelate aminotransferase